MELRIQPFPKNNYPKKGLLIKGPSPLTWLHEMEILGIDLNQIRSFPIPSNELNVLYGCFLIFENHAPNEIGRNSYFQCIDSKFFIPENTTFYPKLNPEDWQNADAKFLIMHPEFGLVKLNEEIDWISLIQNPKPTEAKLIKPSNGVKIPQKIQSYTVEMDDEKVLEALEKPQTEEEWMKNLPFDMKKVMKGNKKEIEKYLKYIERYPDRAVELGVPLDIMGTSRGDGFSKFKFLEGTWFEKLLGGKSRDTEGGNFSGRGYSWVFWVILLFVGLVRLFVHFNKEDFSKETLVSSGKITRKEAENMMKPVIAYQSGVTDIDMKIDSMYGNKRSNLMNERAKLVERMKKDELYYDEYLKKGGKPLSDISKEELALENKITTATDSLKRVYRKKIVKYLVQNEEKIKKKITDSIKKSSSGKPADEGIVKKIIIKKQMLIEDSLGRLYGTKDYVEPPIDPNKAKKVETLEKEKPTEKHDISFAEIFWLIVAMTGAVGLYSFVVKRRSLNVGGENVPSGIKVFLMIVLVAMLACIFYPLIEMFGYNWFVWLLIICVIVLLYRLFSEEKTILKSDKDE